MDIYFYNMSDAVSGHHTQRISRVALTRGHEIKYKADFVFIYARKDGIEDVIPASEHCRRKKGIIVIYTFRMTLMEMRNYFRTGLVNDVLPSPFTDEEARKIIRGLENTPPEINA